VRIFVCEFVTGGGLYRDPLPESLAGEGALMLEALLADLAEIPDVQVVASRDVRLPVLRRQAEMVMVAAGDDVWQIWEQCIRHVDAVWPIAPESGGMLERLSLLVLRHGKRLLNSSPEAVAIAASKRATLSVLADAGLDVTPTFLPDDDLPTYDGRWVAKPDDGIGCEDSRYFDDTADLRAWLGQQGRMRTHVIQPYLAGTAASLSMLCKDGRTWLLSCNRQMVELRQNIFSYHGSVLNAMAQHWDDFERVASVVANAMPGLAGYVGVDMLVDDGRITVLEVNPRLTTSYAGLGRAMGCNPAGLVLDLLYNENLQTLPRIERNVVTISLDE
jgi:tyramine---L-glutamate ligase